MKAEHINLIEYGNPTREEMEILAKNIRLESAYSKFVSSVSVPENSSELTLSELNLVAEKTSDFYPKHPLMVAYADYDFELEEAFYKQLRAYQLTDEQMSEIKDLVTKARKVTDPVLLRAKFKYGRPRPYQLARVFRIRLFPFASNSAQTPSFPSGHSFQAHLWGSLVVSLHPHLRDPITDFIQKVSESRIALGLHYPSDVDAGYHLSTTILEDKSFNDYMNLKEEPKEESKYDEDITSTQESTP